MRAPPLYLSVLVIFSSCAGERSDSALSVFVASSLGTVFGEIEEDFAKQTGIKIELNVASTPILVSQIREGARVDVIVVPDREAIDALSEDGRLGPDPRLFATNRLEIAVERGNPKRIDDLADLASKDVRVALAAAQVPVGRFARQAFAKAGVRLPDASQEDSVQGVLSKVELGEVDAGIVYHSDVIGSQGVEGIEIPTGFNVEVSCWAAVASASTRRDDADRFLSYLESPQAIEILVRHGFDVAKSP